MTRVETEGQGPADGERASAAATTAEFAELMQRHQSQLFAYLHSLVRDFNDTDDLFQQTAMILWRKFDQYDRSRGFVAWACGVARFEVSNFLRTRGRSRLYFSDDLNLLLIEAQAEVASDEVDGRREALTQCVDKLRERDRELVREAYGQDEAQVASVADRIGRSSHSVHNSLRRIRRALFECVQRTLAQSAHAEGTP